MSPGKLLTVALGMVASGWFGGGAAAAATYDVHACRVPSGLPAPAHGWSPVTPATVASLNCPGGMMSIRTPPGTHSPGWQYGVGFNAPTGTRIVGLDLHVEARVVPAPGAPPTWSWGYNERGVIIGADTSVAIGGSYNGPSNHMYAGPTGKPMSRVELVLRCSEYTSACPDNGSSFNVRRVALSLDDSTPPRVLQSSGSLLATTGPQRGERHLALRLQDVGGGLYKVRVDVDGELMDELPIDNNQGVCTRPFVTPVPCKLAASVDVPIDTTRLTEGRHTILVRAFDATGINAATVGPVSLLVDNQPEPPPRGTEACPPTNAAKVRRRLKAKVVRFGRSASIVGRVSGSRSILKGARVGVVDNASLSRRPRLRRLDGEADSVSGSARSRPRKSSPSSSQRPATPERAESPFV